MNKHLRPAAAWRQLLEGNERFYTDSLVHPHEGRKVREELAEGQAPIATVFGCADSRVSAEIIFDQGLGDLFVVRTAGHVIDSAVLGSLEFGVSLRIPLIIVLGHEKCGAIKATMDARERGQIPVGFIRDLVQRISLSAYSDTGGLPLDADRMLSLHIKETIRLMLERSQVIRDAVESGECAVVGLRYSLVKGKVEMVDSVGNIGE